MNLEKYRNSLDNIKAPDELVNDTIYKMNAHSVKRKRISRLWTGVAAAVLSMSLIGFAGYAYNRGLPENFFGSSADKLLSQGDHSAEIENLQIICDNDKYYFEIISTYICDEFMIYEADIKRTDGKEIIPYNSFYETGFNYESAGSELKLKSGKSAEHSSYAMGMTDDGGIAIMCNLYSADGFAQGDHIHLVLEKIFRTEDHKSGSVVSDRVTAEIGFDIATLPQSDKRIIEVNETAVFGSGYYCEIDRVTVSPVCLTVSINAPEAPEFTENFIESSMVLKSGEEIMTGGINISDDGSRVFLLRDDMKIIMPDEIAEIHIGDLVIGCR